MKKCILTFRLIFSSIILVSQSFVPIGATWYYYQFIEMGDTSFVKIESVGDTVILGYQCQIIEVPDGVYLIHVESEFGSHVQKFIKTQ